MKRKFFFFLFFTVISTLIAQDDIALLLKGPDKDSGLEFLGPNTIIYYKAIYEYKEKLIDIYYTNEEIVPYKIWQNEKCKSYRLKSFLYQDKKINYYGINSKYHFFIVNPEGFTDKCKFLNKFINRLEYFYRVSLKTNEIPLPAVLNFKK